MSSEPTRSPTLRMLGVIAALVAVSLVIGGEVFARLIAPAAPLNFDEAAHSLEGFYILRDVMRLDLRELWVNLNAQTLWPPGFSVLQAPVLALLGVNDNAARTFGYVMLVLTVLMGCAIAHEIEPQLAPVAALVGGLFALASPGWLFVSSWAMQETPVALVTFVVFWLFLKALKKRSVLRFATTSVGLLCLFLTKYNYAAFALAAIALVDAGARIGLARKSKAGRIYSVGSPSAPRQSQLGEIFTFAALYGPFALGLLIWFFGAQDVRTFDVKWRDFRFFVSNEDSGYAFLSPENLLFYVRATADWLMPSAWLALAALLGAGIAIARVRKPGIALLAVYFAIGFVLATLHQLKAPRYITPIFPSLWLLGGFGAAVIWRELRSQRAKIACAVAVLALTLVSWLTWLPRLQPVWGGDVAESLRAAADQIVAWQQPGKPILIVGTFGELSPPHFEWRFRPVRAFGESDAPIQYDAPPGDGDDIARVRAWAAANPGAQITTIKVSPSSPLFNTDDMQNKNLWRQRMVDNFDQVSGYQLAGRIEFPRAGLTISYFLPEP